MTSLITLIKREIWEHKRGFLISNGILVGLMSLLMVYADIQVDLQTERQEDPEFNTWMTKVEAGNILVSPADAAMYAVSLPLLVLMAFNIIVYLTSCLADDQKDRSIEFWNSFPVSTTQTVFAKYITGMIVMPITSLVIVAVVQLFAATVMQARLEYMFGDVWAQLHLGSIWAATLVNYLVFLLGSSTLVGLLLIASANVNKPMITSFLAIFALATAEYLLVGDIFQFTATLFIDMPFVSSGLFGQAFEIMIDGRMDTFSALTYNAVQTLHSSLFWFVAMLGVVLIMLSIQIRNHKYKS